MGLVVPKHHLDARRPVWLTLRIRDTSLRGGKEELMKSALDIRGIPPGWQVIGETEDGKHWWNHNKQLGVIASISIENDGKWWLHVSMSHPKRMPTYKDICYLKRHWIGEEAEAIMVFPRKSNHVNLHKFCLHLWHCLDGYPLPEFSGFIKLNGVQLRSI